jgi:hypothetical protein
MIEEEFRNYLAAFNGCSAWADVEPLFDAVFHPKLRVVLPDGVLNRDGWAKVVRRHLSSGTVLELLELERQGDGLFYATRIRLDDGIRLEPFTQALLENEQVIRIEPSVPEEYAQLFFCVDECVG